MSLYVSPKRCYMLPKFFWTIHRVGGTFPPSEILRGKRTKFFGKHIAFFGLYARCSLITIATFLENITINKKYATKTVLFATF